MFNPWTFNFEYFVGMAIHIKIIQDPNELCLFIHFSNIKNNLKSTNSSVHEHVHRRQSTEFRAHQKLISQYITKTCITQAVYNVYTELIFYRNYRTAIT